jgi:hypothetical protein
VPLDAVVRRNDTLSFGALVRRNVALSFGAVILALLFPKPLGSDVAQDRAKSYGVVLCTYSAKGHVAILRVQKGQVAILRVHF